MQETRNHLPIEPLSMGRDGTAFARSSMLSGARVLGRDELAIMEESHKADGSSENRGEPRRDRRVPRRRVGWVHSRRLSMTSGEENRCSPR